MEKKYHEDQISHLIKKEGLLHTSDDFTSEVMDQIACSNLVDDPVYQPLIGLKGWIVIGLSVAMLIACCIVILLSVDHDATSYIGFLEPVREFFKGLKISWNINFGSLFIATMVMLSILIMLVIDSVFSTSVYMD